MKLTNEERLLLVQARFPLRRILLNRLHNEARSRAEYQEGEFLGRQGAISDLIDYLDAIKTEEQVPIEEPSPKRMKQYHE